MGPPVTAERGLRGGFAWFCGQFLCFGGFAFHIGRPYGRVRWRGLVEAAVVPGVVVFMCGLYLVGLIYDYPWRNSALASGVAGVEFRDSRHDYR